MGNSLKNLSAKLAKFWTWLCNIDSALSWLTRAAWLGAFFWGLPALISNLVAPQVSASLVGLLFFVLGQAALILALSWHQRKAWLAIVALVAVAGAFFWGGWTLHEPSNPIGKVVETWGFERKTFYALIDGNDLMTLKDKHRIAVGCRPYDASVEMAQDTENILMSKSFSISSNQIRIEVHTDLMWDRMALFKLVECSLYLTPLKPFVEGQSVDLHGIQTMRVSSPAYALRQQQLRKRN